MDVTNKCKVKFSGYIGNYENSVEMFNQQLLNVGANEILDISIDSNGGSYLQAMKIYDRIAQHSGKKRIRIAPVAASAGAVLALDPKAEVIMPANGLIYHHAAEVSMEEARNPEELRKTADELETVGSTLVEMIVARCGKPHEQVKAMLNEGRWFTAEEAKEYGLVDEVEPLNRRKTNIKNLVLPEQIVAHVDSLNQRSETMALKDVCAKLKLEITDEMTDEQLEEVIVNHNGTLLKTIEEAPKRKDPPKFSEGITNVLIRDRESSIQSLVEEGKITPAVADDLKKEFASRDKISNCFDEVANPIDNFETTIAALKKNEKVVNFGGRKKERLEKEGEVTESVVVANARARGTA